jgi:hypothetical protein
MMTEFENIRIVEDGSVGQIKTLSEFSVFDCYAKKWSDKPKVIFRNIMLCGLYPNKDFCMGEIRDTEKDYRRLNPFKPEGDDKSWFLDLASGARTDGRFTFTRDTTIGKLYYGQPDKEQWKRIIYGSIMHTGCKKLVYKQMKYIVVDDEATNQNGNPQDDPTNQFHWRTGDSHAKASGALMTLLEITKNDDGTPLDGEIPIQFRACLPSRNGQPGWVGKGTVSWNPHCDEKGIDLVIPLSSLKGNKPELGNYEGKLLIGTVFEAEERRTKLGWMIWQWFAFKTLEDDRIISKLHEKCEKLSAAFNSIQNLAEILQVDQKEEDKQNQETGEPVETDDYKSPVLRIIKADKKGVLLLHPYVIERVRDGIKEMWLNLAKSCGVRFYSLMAQPDENLAHYHVVQDDGTIVGRKVFCAGSLPEGEYIVYCNPMRHWGDIQLWENKHEGIYQGALGTMAAPKLLLLSLGRDTDGDFIQLIKSNKYPGIRDAIAQFDKPPTVAKLPKVALTGNLQQIAVNSMTDLTGVVASLLGRARAANAEQIVLKIPPGGEQKQEKEMRIIEFLSQELQIAVDSLKSAYPNNEAGLKAVTDFLNSINAAAPWLKDFKDESCYRNRPCAVDPNAEDTVSRIVKIVNSYYREPSFGAPVSPRDFLSVLFGDVSHAPEQYQHALSERARYREEMAAASNLATKQAGGDAGLASQLRSQYMKQVSANFRNIKETIFEISNANDQKYDRFSWVSAYWKVAHEAETGSAGLVFSTFVDEIIEKLENADDRDVDVIEVYNIQKTATFDLWKTKRWTGQFVQYKAVYEPLKVDSFGNPGMYKLTIHIRSTKVEMPFHRLGIVGDKYVGKVSVGQTGVMRLCTHRTIDGINKSAKLFSVDTTYEEAVEQVETRFWKEEWPDN